MNRYLIFLLLCFHALPQYGQKVEEYYPEGTVWKELCKSRYYPGYRGVTEYRVAEVNYNDGKVYRRIYVNGSYSPYSVRQEDSLVYFRYADTEQRYERRLYDFNWYVGKTLEFSQLYHLADSTTWTSTVKSIEKYIAANGDTLDWLPRIEMLRTVGSLRSIIDRVYRVPSGSPLDFEVVSFIRNGEELVDGYSSRERFVVPGKEWTVWNAAPDSAGGWYSRYVLSGDTILGGRDCLKLTGFDVSGPGTGMRYCGSIYEDYGMVYIFKPFRISSEYAYDFNLLKDDYVTVYDGNHSEDVYMIADRSILETEGQQLVNLQLFRGDFLEITANSTEGLPWNRWIEGVGSVLGPLNYGPCSEAEPSTRLVSCTVDGRTLYLDETLAVDAANLTPLPQISATYDLQGRRVSGTPRPGIYIRGGRKVVYSRRVDK